MKAAAALAFVSAMVDMSGGRLVGTGMVDDGATPPRKVYPSNPNNPTNAKSYNS